jgi:hypothetical protein
MGQVKRLTRKQKELQNQLGKSSTNISKQAESKNTDLTNIGLSPQITVLTPTRAINNFSFTLKHFMRPKRTRINLDSYIN